MNFQSENVELKIHKREMAKNLSQWRWAILGGVALVVGGGCCGWYFADRRRSRHNSPPPTKQDRCGQFLFDDNDMPQTWNNRNCCAQQYGVSDVSDESSDKTYSDDFSDNNYCNEDYDNDRWLNKRKWQFAHAACAAGACMCVETGKCKMVKIDPTKGRFQFTYIRYYHDPAPSDENDCTERMCILNPTDD